MTPVPPRRLDLPAALLSYLIPGLGQVLQGRVGKGLLFFVTLYGLFFYGLMMGKMRNVWVPDTVGLPAVELRVVGQLDGFPKALYYRPQFLGQFWVGLAAWPAVAQYVLTPTPADPAAASPPSPVLRHYMQAPAEAELNTLNRDGEKLRSDLGWVYTVIAGVLNILVIYDALAGPAVRAVVAPTRPPVRREDAAELDAPTVGAA